VSDHAIVLEKLCVDYPGLRALHEISWQLPRGVHGTILGPNGSGKSTLLRSMTGYGYITSGRATVLGETLGETNIHALRRRIGVVDPKLLRFVDSRVTLLQLVCTGFFGNLTPYFDRPTNEQIEFAQAVLAEVGLADRETQIFLTLSAGQQSRAWLARALVNRPELLILDEATGDLDLPGRETFLATLNFLSQRRRGLTTLMVTHHIEDLLPTVGEVLLLANGRACAAGWPDEVLTSKQVSTAFGCPIEISLQNGRRFWSVKPAAWSTLLEDSQDERAFENR
jgi:iron complex transport system ATP-binding protein